MFTEMMMSAGGGGEFKLVNEQTHVMTTATYDTGIKVTDANLVIVYPDGYNGYGRIALYNSPNDIVMNQSMGNDGYVSIDLTGTNIVIGTTSSWVGRNIPFKISIYNI